MARKQHHNSISLFPFLAVLVCAMGALILLLLVMTRKIRQDQADLESFAANVSEVQTVSDRSEELSAMQAEIEQLEQAALLIKSNVNLVQASIDSDHHRKADLLKRLNDLQVELEIAEDETNEEKLAESIRSVRDLTQQEKEILAALETVEKSLLEKRSRLQTLALAQERTKVAMSAKQSALISLRKAVEKAESTPAATGIVTMLEFSNPTGTSRTPIVVDVTDKGYELRPSGILIKPEDLENFPMKDNPLLAGVLTAHRHRVGASVKDDPYVLLLVRPDGCLNFYRAQAILNETKVPFGYELLPSEQVVAVGEPDEKEIAKTKAAIAESLRRREKIYGRLIAIMEQERALKQETSAPEDGRKSRRLVIRPDGRVVESGEDSERPLDGRFYAGGTAPPQNYLDKRPAAGFKPNSDGQLSAAEAEKMVEEFAEEYASQFAENGDEFAADEARAPGKSPADAKVPMTELADAMQPPRAIATRKPRTENATDEVSGDMAQEPLADRQTAGSDAQSLDELVASSRPAGDDTGELVNPNPRIDSLTKSSVGSFDGGRFLQPDQGASSDRTRDYSVVTSKELNARSGSGANAGEVDSGADTKSEGSLSDSPSVEQILAAADKKPDLSRIDPDLLKRLESGKGQSSSLATPIGITVFLDEHHMTVGQTAAIELTEDNLAFAFSALLEGVDQEVKDQKLRPDEPVMPIVKFVVSPGGERWRIRLSPMLRHIGLDSATVFELTPYIMPVDEIDTTGRASLASHAQGAK